MSTKLEQVKVSAKYDDSWTADLFSDEDAIRFEGTEQSHQLYRENISSVRVSERNVLSLLLVGVGGLLVFVGGLLAPLLNFEPLISEASLLFGIQIVDLQIVGGIIGLLTVLFVIMDAYAVWKYDLRVSIRMNSGEKISVFTDSEVKPSVKQIFNQ